MVVAPNGDLYVATRRGSQGSPARWSRFATRTATARFEIKERFGDDSATGIALRNGYLYVAHADLGRALSR